MSKRKRDDDAVAGDGGEPLDYRKHRRIAHAFDDGVEQLARAFKLAKGFERQKLGRRKKQASSSSSSSSKKNDTEHADKETELQRIDTETSALKGLDLVAAAERYLAKSLLRIKAVAGAASLPDALRQKFTITAATIPTVTITAPASAPAPAVSTSTNAEAAMLNVVARLCNSNLVKEALPAVMGSFAAELGVEIDGSGAAGRMKKKRLRAKDFQEDRAGGVMGTQTRDRGRTEGEKKVGKAGKMDMDGLDDEHEAGQDGGADDDSEDEFAAFQARLASSSDNDDDDDGNEHSDTGSIADVEELERQLEKEGVARTAKGTPHKTTYSLAADLSLSDDEEWEDGSSTTPEPRKVVSAPKTSAFLPSLTMGGYISGSGSEGDEVDDEVDVAPRKNRRGQRARQQIWEKKYGAGAKHLQKSDRNRGWDAKRGALNDHDRSGRSKPGSNFRQAPKSGGRPQIRATGANADAVIVKARADLSVKARADPSAKPRRDDVGKLHPSWEAAKRAKEKKSAPAVFQGKKISFD